MENMDNHHQQSDSMIHDHEEEEMMMNHVIQEDHELYYLHVCLAEVLCKKEDEV